MGESDAGNLGDVTWGARLRLQELEADIAAAQQRLDDFYKRNDGRSIGVGAGSGGAPGGGGVSFGGSAGFTTTIESFQRTMEQFSERMARMMGGAAGGSGEFIGPPQSPDRLATIAWREQGTDRYVRNMMAQTRAGSTLGPEDLVGDDASGGSGSRDDGSAASRGFRGIKLMGAVYFAAREAGNAFGAYQQLTMQDPLIQRYGGAEEKLSNAETEAKSQSFMRTNTGPLGFSASIAQFRKENAAAGWSFSGQMQAGANFYSNLTGFERGYGLGGTGAVDAIENAKEALQTAAGNDAAVLYRMRTREGSLDAISQATAIGTVGQYSRREAEASASRDSAIRQLDYNIDEQQQLANSTALSPGERAAAQIRLRTYKSDRASRVSALDTIYTAQIGATEYELNIAQGDMGFKSPALAMAAAGNIGASTGALFEAGLQSQLYGADPKIAPALSAYQMLQRSANAAAGQESLRETEATTNSLQLELAYQPQGAKLADIQEQRRQALLKGPEGGYRPGLSGSDIGFNIGARADINSKFDAIRDLATQQYRDKGADLSYGIAAEHSSIAALNQMNPDTTLSQSIGIRATTYQRVTDLARAGFIDQAHAASAAGQEDIELAEGEFIRGFHGVQVDPRHININAPRGSVNIAKRLKEMEDQKKLLTDQNSTFELKMHVGAFAKDAPRAGSGTGGGVTEMSIDQLTQAIQSAIKSAITN